MEFLPLIFSGLLSATVVIYILRIKFKTQLHNAFLATFALLIVWDSAIIIQLFLLNKNTYLAMYADFIAFIGACYFPVTFLLSAVLFAKTHINFTWKYKLLFVLPTISLIIIWTNDFHHLYYVTYSNISSEMVFGPYFNIHAFYSYGCIFIGLLYYLVFSIRNSGIFSKQALLIIIGVIFPLTTNILFSFKIVPLSNYWTPVFISIFVLCCFLAISKYSFLNIVPIALRHIVDSISDSFIVLNEQLVIVNYNRTLLDIFQGGFKIENGNNIIDLIESYQVIDLDNTAFINQLNKVLLNKESASFEKHIVTQLIDMYFSVELSPILLQDRCIGIIIFLKDITELRKSLETISESQAMLRSERHDFANHLNTLYAMVKLNKPDTLDRLGKYLSKLINNSNNLSNETESGDVCFNALLSVKINFARQKNIDFKANFDIPLSDIDIDDVDLVSTVGNIIDNAFDAVMTDQRQTHPKTISVHSYANNNKAYISVSNNGLKIPDSDLDKIFVNKFSTKSGTEGERGFGLYITKELVTKNKGKILVSSTELETEFLLELRMKDAGGLM